MGKDHAGSGSAALGAPDWLSLAAAPTFAIMTLLTSVGGDLMAGTPCSVAHSASPLGGMALMYALMSAFHLTPWLKLLPWRRRTLGG